MGKGSIQFVLIFLHHSVAETTWLLEQSQAYQQSSANGPWLLHISSCNPAVYSETTRIKEVNWKLCTLHVTFIQMQILFRSAPIKERRGKKVHLHQTMAFLWIMCNPVGVHLLSFSTARWRKEYEWLKRCHDFEEGECFQFLAYWSGCWVTDNRKHRRASHEALTLSQRISGTVMSLSGKQRGTRRIVDVWHARTSSDLKDNLQEWAL